MMSKRAILCAVSLMIAASGPLWAATAAKKRGEAKPRGKTETLACRLGTEDRHARIAVVVIRGKTDSFAYYSKWKPRTCSVYLQRNRDMYSKWADSGDITTVSLEKGAFLIEHKPGEYHFIFRDIDRERYCGMDGVLNGSLTIKRGSDQCVLDGELMVEGTPLGEANVAREEDKAPPGLMPVEPEVTAAASAAPAGAAPGKPVASSAAASKPSTPAPGNPAPAKPAAAAAPAAPAKAALAVSAPGKPAASPAASAAAADSAPAAAASAAPAAPAAAPSAASIEKPAAGASAEGATRAQAEPPAVTGAVPAAPTPAPQDAPRVAEKPADAPSGNPFSAFFRSISPGTPPVQH